MATSRSRVFSRLAKDLDTSGNIKTEGIASDVSLGGGVTIYSGRANLPASGNTAGDQAYVTGNNRLYIWNGSGWYNVALLNVAPSITSVQDSDGGTTPFSLSAEGVTTTITITAADSDGDPITYEYSADSDFDGLATISQDSSVFTITPLSQDSATTSSGTITFTATDGVNTGSSGVQTFNLNFLSEYWKDVVLNIGTSDSDGLANDTFIDRSANAHTVTASGSPVQNAFHPYLDNWSVELNGSSYFTVGSTTDWTVLHNGLNTWTLEFTCYITDMSATNAIFGTNVNSTTGNRGLWVYVNSSGQLGGSFTAGTDGYRLDWAQSSTGLISENNWHTVSLTFNPDNSQGNYFSAIIDDTSITEFTEQTIVQNSNSSNDFVFGTGAPVYPLYVGAARGPFSGVISIFNGYLTNFEIEVESETKLQCFSDNRFIDRSSNNYTFSLVSSPKISAFNPLGQESEYDVGENKGSSYFDGSGDYLSVPDNSDFDYGSEDFTLECWFVPASSLNAVLLTAHTSGGVYGPCNLFFSGGALQFFSSSNNSSWDVASSVTVGTPAVNAWNHVAVSREGNSIRCFLNGVLGSTTTSSATLMNATGTFQIGARNGSQNFTGYISDFRVVKGTAVYTAAFTPPTAPVGNTNASLYLPMDNAGIFDKTGNHTLTLNGNTATSTTQTKFADTAMYFDGTDDAITINENLDVLNLKSGPFTVEAWYYQTSSQSYATIASMHDPDNDKRAWTICQIGSGSMGYYVSSNGTGTSYRSSGSKPLNQWTHIAFTRDESNIVRLFINGTQGGTDLTFATIFDTGGDVPLVIGGQWDGSASTVYREFPGYIENLQILNGVAKYTANFTLPTRTQGRNYQAES